MSVLCETLSHKDSADIILKNGSLGVSNHKRAPLRFGTLHDVRLDEKACFAAAGTADDQYVLVPCVFGIRRAAAHGQALRLGQDDVVPRVSVHERRNVVWLSP